MLVTEFKASKPSGSEEEYFSIYFYGLILQPLARSHLGPWDLYLNKIGKGPLGYATIKISSI